MKRDHAQLVAELADEHGQMVFATLPITLQPIGSRIRKNSESSQFAAELSEFLQSGYKTVTPPLG